MHESLDKALFRLNQFIFIVSVLVISTLTYYQWLSIVNESKAELSYANKIVSRSLQSLLNKDEALFRITGERLIEVGLYEGNIKAQDLIDKLLANNPELEVISIANLKGKVFLSSSNLLQKIESNESFKKALASEHLVMGRAYYMEGLNDWLLPIKYAIRNGDKETVAILTAGIRVVGKNSPWQSGGLQESIFTSVIDGSYYYYLLTTNINKDNLEDFYKKPISKTYLEYLAKTVIQQTGSTILDYKKLNSGTVFLDYFDPYEDKLISIISYNKKYNHFVFTSKYKAELISKLLNSIIWYLLLLIAFNIILYRLFKFLYRLQKQSKANLLYQSQHDKLTGLPNLLYIFSKMGASDKKNESVYTLLYIDLDNFKNCNDVYGHIIGDKILVEVGKRLKVVFNNEICIRQGGDEFFVLVSKALDEGIMDLSRIFLASIKQPILINELEFSVRASVGISQSPKDGKDIETLIRKADLAMYEAKRRKSGIYVFTKELEKTRARKAQIGKELNNALVRNELSLVYQPQFDIKTKNIIGVEALVRWNNDTLKEVPPSEFIPIAESTGAILEIGNFVIENALKEFEEVCNEILENKEINNLNQKFRLSINVSIMQLSNPNFLNHLFKNINKYRCKKAKLMLEITETLFIESYKKMGSILDRIRRSGIEISLDDFGTGYSSLSYLSKLPLNELKIDKSFISDLTTDENSLALIKSIISLGNSLGLEVLAEGIETEEQFDILKTYYCKNIQGFYMSKPLKKDELLKFLKK